MQSNDAFYLLSPAARQDLLDIWDYIAADNLDAADQVRDAIFTAMNQLAIMPEMGHFREDLTDEPLRFWKVYSYLVIYQPEVRPLEIVRILSAYRDISSLLP